MFPKFTQVYNFRVCAFAINEVKAGRLKPQHFKRCGFEGYNAIICCKENVSSDPVSARKAIEACNKIREIVVPPTIDYAFNSEPVDIGDFPHQAGEWIIAKKIILNYKSRA